MTSARRTRFLVALALVLHASTAQGLSIRPPEPWAARSPSGQFVYVNVPYRMPDGADPHAQAIRERCNASGLYRVGAWDAPLWAFGSGHSGWVADDGVHVVLVMTRYGVSRPSKDQPFGTNYCFTVYAFYARGKGVGELNWTHFPRTRAGGSVLRSAGFGPDGLFRVIAADGNETVYDPGTGRRVAGVGAEDEPVPPADDPDDAPSWGDAPWLRLERLTAGVIPPESLGMAIGSLCGASAVFLYRLFRRR